MKTLVTGSSGHLGEALMRALRGLGCEAAGLDIIPSSFTTYVGSIVEREDVRAAMSGVRRVFHAATLHKPHVGTHDRQDFIDVNITGTLNLLEEAVAANVESFVFTSTTSVFGDALIPPAGAPARWVTEDMTPTPKNIYGVTKAAAEDLCALFHRNQKLACLVLRTSRFFPEEDDDATARGAFLDANLKANEFLSRRVDIEDVVSAHFAAADRAPEIGFGRYIVSATTPFTPDDLADLRRDAAAALRRRVPACEAEYARRGWRMSPVIDRIYVNDKARRELGWRPRHDFAALIERLKAGGEIRSPLAQTIGAKGYHAIAFAEGPYPVERDSPRRSS